MPRRLVIGLSSGASLQGIRAALVEAHGTGLDLRLRLIHTLHRPYPTELREMLWRFSSSTPPTPRQTAVCHRILGDWFAGAALQLVEQAQVPLGQILCVGFPGQVVWQDTEMRHPAALCLAMPEAVAEKTGLTVVSHFRGRDIVAGGKAAPLTAVIDAMLFRHATEERVLVHLGGWAGVLHVPAGREGKARLSGFQAAPCGLLLDGAIRLLTSGKAPFDAWGKHAVQGRCIEPLLTKWLSHPPLQRKPPRSLTLDDFGEAFIAQGVALARSLERGLHDVLCTATHFVAAAIAQAIESFVPVRPARVILSGGAVKNGLLLRLLEQQFGGCPVERLDLHGCPTEARHALGYAGLTLLTLDGVPGNVPSVTGAAGPRLLGQLTPGSTANWARCLSWMAHQLAPFQAAA